LLPIPVEEELLLLVTPTAGGVGVALLGARLLTVEHAVEVHVHLWVLRLQLREHVLNVRHDALNVYEVWVLAVCTSPWLWLWLWLLLLLLVPLAIHVRVSEGLRRVSTSRGLGSRPSLLLLLLRLEIPLHEVFVVLLPPP